MKTSFKLASVSEVSCDAIGLPLFQGWKKPDSNFLEVDKKSNGFVQQILKEEGFKGKEGEVLVIHMRGEVGAKRVLVLGLGSNEKFTKDTVRRAAGTFARKAQALKLKKIALPLIGQEKFGPGDSAHAIVEGALLGTYSFKKYKTENDENSFPEELVLVDRDKRKAVRAKDGLKFGEIFSKATCLARNLANEPASSLTPTDLATIARKIAQDAGVTCSILTKKEIEKLGMGGLIGVSKGSVEEPRFIALSYKPKGKSAKKVALIGKGITFDSGGLSLKPADAMEKMKNDMSGAATVLGVFSAIKEIRPKYEVLGIIAATENMPSGSALKPGDVLRIMNGKTVEVVNTDAEGRLILADALFYAVKEGADELIDIATLTKACSIALGPQITGVMSNNKALLKRVISAADRAGEKFWELPLEQEYRDTLRSDIADMKNSGGREGGAVIAGLFLKEFVDEKPWVHLDIAGPSWVEKDEPTCSKGPSGVGVRTFLTYLSSK
ncbi:MAG: leucyl aminopeptidase [Candidatus Eisenbacteria bacterium]|nr:leucyl aminopeptidase [Candidatus Eisenbacteria bacterium]